MLFKVLRRISHLTSQSKLVPVLNKILSADKKLLRDPDQVAILIRSAGLNYDLRGAYGSDNAYMNMYGDGLWQVPLQLATALVELSAHPITSLIEIGTSKGWTSSFLTAYLLRFNPNLKAITVDPYPQFAQHPRVRSILPLEFAAGKTSENFRGKVFDLAFIDGDHSYPWLVKDYDNVGKAARLAMFHDINDDFVANKEGNDGGVRRFWAELKQRESNNADFLEFTNHSDGKNVMGIGLRLRK